MFPHFVQIPLFFISDGSELPFSTGKPAARLLPRLI